MALGRNLEESWHAAELRGASRGFRDGFIGGSSGFSSRVARGDWRFSFAAFDGFKERRNSALDCRIIRRIARAQVDEATKQKIVRIPESSTFRLVHHPRACDTARADISAKIRSIVREGTDLETTR